MLKLFLLFWLLTFVLSAVQPSYGDQPIVVPDWAWPGTAKHKQVPPPKDFHRPTVTFDVPSGVFDGQSDIGGPLLPGSANYNPRTKEYTVSSASYNIWYTRDEFRFLWKKMSGDISLAADVTFPDTNGFNDRKVVFVIRQDLDDDSKEIMTAVHGRGMMHLALRPEKGADCKEAAHIVGKPWKPGEKPVRLGIEKHGDTFSLYVSTNGEPMHQMGKSADLHFDEPFYVGIGFCSHVPDKMDTAEISNVVFENAAGKVH